MKLYLCTHELGYTIESLTMTPDILRQRTTDVDIKKYFVECLDEVSLCFVTG